MATLKPFAALRPKPELAAKICELPYDVMSSEEARDLAFGNPLSFLHVSKPEIDLSPGTDVYAPEVYATGKQNFQKLIAQGALKQDAQPNFYFYRQIMGGHSQTGLVAAASCREYLNGIIKKHELTRPDKEDDRVRHIETLNSQTGPVFLTYQANPSFDAFVAKKTAEKPGVDFTAKDGVRHSSWTISDPKDIQFIQSQFAQIADASHLVVFAAKNNLDVADVDAHVRHLAAGQGVSIEALAPFRNVLVGGIVQAMDEPARNAWARNQCYIALGNLLTSAAVLGIDACPMEGFDRAQYDEILGLKAKGYASAVIATLGYRSTEDKYAAAPKVRFPKEQLIARV